jgi:hypothetical protein
MRLDIMDKDYREAKNHVYGLAHNVCINGIEQKILLNELRSVEFEMRAESGQTIISTMLGIILDGLHYGNWPWIKNGVNTLKSDSTSESYPNEKRTK